MPIDMAPLPMGNLQGFQIAPPQSADPLETLARMSQLRTQGLQQQQAGLQLQQQQMQLASNRAIMQAMAEGGGDLEGTMNAMKNHPNILPQDWLGIQQHAMQYATQQAALTKDKLGIQNEQHEQWASLLKAKPIDSQDALNSVIRQGVARGLPVPQEFLDQQGNVMPYTGDPQHYVAMANGLQLLSQLSKQNLEAMQAKEAEQKGVESAATAAKTNLETQRLRTQLNFLSGMIQNPKGLQGIVDSQIGDPRDADLNRQAFGAAQSAAAMKEPQAVLDAIKPFALQAAERQKVRSPSMIAANAEQKRQDVLATTGPEAAKAGLVAQTTQPITIATETGKKRAEGGLLPAPWNTLDPTTGREGLNKSLAFDEAYIKKMTAAQNTINTIGAALRGNQKAAQYVTIEQLKSQLQRVTGTEIAATDAGGSLMRRIGNDIATKFTGRPLAATLKDSLALADLEKTAADSEYGGNQLALSNNYKVGPLPHATLPKGVTPAPTQRTANKPAAQGGYIPGHKYNGMTYLGGDPHNAASWKQ